MKRKKKIDKGIQYHPNMKPEDTFSLRDKNLQMLQNFKKSCPVMTSVMPKTYISQKICIAKLVLDVMFIDVHEKYRILNLEEVRTFQLKPTLTSILVAYQIMSI